jgi:signal transduction histidine kinase
MDLNLIKQSTVLYVEDDWIISKTFQEFTTSYFKKIITAQDGLEGLKLFRKHRKKIDIIITDISMPKINGIDMIKEIRELDFEVPIVITSAFNDNQLLNDAINLAIDGFVKKPLNIKHLMSIINKALKPVFYKKELQKKDMILFQRSKFSALGEMIGNIAHQWRQPLNSIGATMMKLELQCENDICSPNDITDAVRKTNSILKHMSKTIDDFRNFFEPNKDKEFFKLDESINSINALLTPQLVQHNIQLNISGDPQIEIFGYSNEIKQVLINIVSNAKDSIIINKIENGCININIEQNDDKVDVIVQDNGKGIPQNIIEKIFEPYFTTKFKSQGTGIGLYMSKIIIEKNMHGSLTASNLNDGALFRISLPIIKKEKENLVQKIAEA